MRARLITLLAFAVAGTALAADDSVGPAPQVANADLLGNVDFAVDRDGVHVSGVRLGGVHACGAFLDQLGFSATAARDAQPGPMRDTSSFASALARQAAADKGINAEAGFLQVAGRTRVVGDATWRAQPIASTALSLIAAGDLVPTQAAIDRGVAYGFVGGSAERTLVERVTANGVAGYQTFTDGNERLHVRARVTWQAMPAYGLNAQIRWRQFERLDAASDAAYFNPERYSQLTGVLDVRRQLLGWTVAGAVGAGIETIEGTERRPVRTAELRADGPAIDKLHLALYARYNRAADDSEFPDPSFLQAGVTLRYPF
jgi:hypothetical protein